MFAYQSGGPICGHISAYEAQTMCGREIIVEALKSYYGSTSLLKYSESDDEIRFQVPTPITDRQTGV